MKIAALLTGRGNNTLKDKNVLPVYGRPLLQYPCLAAKACKEITAFYVSSDDEKILNVAAECGYKKIKRPDELALPTAQHVDAITHALGVMKKDGCEPDILVVQLANSAIVKAGWIEESIQRLIDNPNLSAAVPVMEEMDHHPYRSKRLREDGCLDTWFDFTGKKISTNRQDLPKNYVLCHNFWTLNLRNSIYSKEPGQQPWSFMGNNIYPIVVEESFDVHDMEDLIKSEKWLKENKASLGFDIEPVSQNGGVLQ